MVASSSRCSVCLLHTFDQAVALRQVHLTPSPTSFGSPSSSAVINVDLHSYGYLVVNRCAIRQLKVGHTEQKKAKLGSELSLYSLNDCSGESRLGCAEFDMPLLPFSLIPSSGNHGQFLSASLLAYLVFVLTTLSSTTVVVATSSAIHVLVLLGLRTTRLISCPRPQRICSIELSHDEQYVIAGLHNGETFRCPLW
jgi:hypothetical protein